MATFLPFNQNPSSIAIKTSSYTIPADYYARVIVTNFETDFTIDSVIAVEAVKYIGTFTTGAGTKFTNTSAYVLRGDIQHGTDGSTHAVRHSGGSATSANYFMLGASTQTANTANASSAKEFGQDMYLYANNPSGTSYYSFHAMDTPTKMEYWVPTGTDLDGTRYTVELYAIP